MDLDLNEEQEMLREMVRGVCSSYANLETVRELEDDPVGFPAELWKQLAELDLIGLMMPGGVRRLGDERARGRGRLHGARARARAVAALRERGDGARACCCGPGRDEQKQAWLPRIVVGRRDRHDRVARARQRLRRARRADARASPTATTSCSTASKWHVPFAQAATAIVVLARTGDADTDVDLFLVDPARAGRDARRSSSRSRPTRSTR